MVEGAREDPMLAVVAVRSLLLLSCLLVIFPGPVCDYSTGQWDTTMCDPYREDGYYSVTTMLTTSSGVIYQL